MELQTLGHSRCSGLYIWPFPALETCLSPPRLLLCFVGEVASRDSMCLNSWIPAGGILLKGCGDFRRWNLPGGGESPGRVMRLWSPPQSLCLLCCFLTTSEMPTVSLLLFVPAPVADTFPSPPRWAVPSPLPPLYWEEGGCLFFSTEKSNKAE